MLDNKEIILKYKVPKERRHLYNDKKIIYCKVHKKQELSNGIYICKVSMINNKNYPEIFADYELTKLNFIDKIKLKKIEENKNGYKDIYKVK